jgi:hypothetical protein
VTIFDDDREDGSVVLSEDDAIQVEIVVWFFYACLVIAALIGYA